MGYQTLYEATIGTFFLRKGHSIERNIKQYTLRKKIITKSLTMQFSHFDSHIANYCPNYELNSHADNIEQSTTL
jgi:hypothetical protein